VVARCIWSYVCEFVGYEIGRDYLSISSKWLNKEKFYVAVVLSGLWLIRNSFVFNKLRKIQKLWSLELKTSCTTNNFYNQFIQTILCVYVLI
jgi:hypothetical protein